MNFYSFHPGMKLTCKQRFFHPGMKLSQKYRNSRSVQKKPLEVFYTKGVLKNFTKFTGKYLHQSLFLIKLQASGLPKSDPDTQVFYQKSPLKNFLRTSEQIIWRYLLLQDLQIYQRSNSIEGVSIRILRNFSGKSFFVEHIPPGTSA